MSCRLAVIHGGAGSTFGAVSCGIPLLVAPQSADQFVNAGERSPPVPAFASRREN